MNNENYQELQRAFEESWNEGRSKGGDKALFWDSRAHEWAANMDSDRQTQERTAARVGATVEYFLRKGILHDKAEIIDIGCGLGRFVLEFAKHAGHVIGSDISLEMLKYAAGYAKNEGLKNVSYVPCDFKEFDPKALGWERRFDLVFASITPVVYGDGLDKFMSMSKKWCFNSSFVRREDAFMDRMLSEIFGTDANGTRDASWNRYYTLSNVLMLRGYLPEITYYKEGKQKTFKADMESAKNLAIDAKQRVNKKIEEMQEPIFEYLKENADENGNISINDTVTYAWTLWDVSKKV